MSAPLTKRQREALQRDDGGFHSAMLRHHLRDVLESVPADALACIVALDYADDDYAYDKLAAVIACLREAAASMNELRRETRKGAA